VKTHNFPPHKVRLKTKGDSDVYVIRNTFDPGGFLRVGIRIQVPA
jgi:hypothetical protein